MANEIDLVVGQVAFDKITELIGRLKDVDTEFSKIADKFSNLGKTGNPQSTAELAKLTAENQKLNKALNDLKASYTTIDTELAKNTKLITDATLATKAKTAADTLALKATEDQNSAYVKAAGAYANLDAQHKLAVKTAQDLAVATGRSTKEYELAKNKANELGKQLRVIDTDIGKHSRNVGNYASSWNGLGNSINQLTREAPAFANSVQTGFMALSNNIPILTDELGVLIQKNKDLQAEGKPTQSILKTVAGAFFSWQTAISLGVTILTVYGAKLYELATAGNAAAQAQKALAEINATAAKDASKEIGQLDVLYRTSQNHALSIEQRKKAVDKMQEVYPSYFANLKDEEILNGKAKDSYLDLRDGILASARAKAISSKLDENAATRFDKELELQNKIVAAQKDVKDAYALNKDIRTQVLGSDGQYYETTITRDKEIELSNYRLKKSKQDLFNFNQQAGKDDLFLLKELEKADIKAAKRNFDATKVKEEKVVKPKKDKSAEEAAKKEEERLKIEYEALLSNLKRQKEIDKDSLESFKGSIIEKTKLSIQLAATEIDIANIVFEEKKRLAKGDVNLITVANNEKKTAEENASQENLKRIEKLYQDRDKLAEDYAKSTEFNFLGKDYQKNFDKNLEEDTKKREKYKKDIEDYLGSFTDEFASKLGLSETFKMLSGDIVGFGKDAKVTFVAIAESAQEMFNMINQNSEANFQEELKRLDNQKQISLGFAGDSTAAKEKIEKDYDKKRKELELKQFKDKQKMAVVNIAIDTAQAIMQIWAHSPDPTGISQGTMSIIIGALGAIETGMVLAQKPPAYAEGTDNHSGGLMLVNDGKGSNFQEKVILPSGKVIRPQGRNVLMDAPKGTKVLNHEQQLFEMLQSNNISMSSPQSSGLTYEEMNEIFQKNLSNIKTQNTIFDKNGFQSYVKNGNSITRSNSNRSQAIGISV